MTYRYLGTKSLIVTPDGHHNIEVFGQALDLPQDQAEQMVRDRAPLLPEFLWGTLGITEDELADHPSVLAHEFATPEFIAKRNRGWELLHEYRQRLNDPPVATPAPVPAPAETRIAADPASAVPETTHEKENGN